MLHSFIGRILGITEHSIFLVLTQRRCRNKSTIRICYDFECKGVHKENRIEYVPFLDSTTKYFMSAWIWCTRLASALHDAFKYSMKKKWHILWMICLIYTMFGKFTIAQSIWGQIYSKIIEMWFLCKYHSQSICDEEIRFQMQMLLKFTPSKSINLIKPIKITFMHLVLMFTAFRSTILEPHLKYEKKPKDKLKWKVAKEKNGSPNGVK